MDHLVDHLFIFEGDGKIKDYHSNYTEYRQQKALQRKNEIKQQKAEKPVYERVRSNKPKATFKEKKEYEQLTADIDALNQERSDLEAMLSGSKPATTDEITKASQRIGEIIALLDDKELRWLELDEIVNG